MLLALLIGWTVLREAEVGPLRPLMHGPALRQARLLDRDHRRVAADALARAARCAAARASPGASSASARCCGPAATSTGRSSSPTTPSSPCRRVSDAGYLAFYPLVFAGLCLLVRSRVEGAPKTLWVDGLTAALAAAAMSAAVVLQAVLHTVGGNALGVATNLAYPVGDLILLARGRRRLRAARLARRSHVGAAGPGHRALLDRRLLLPGHRRQRDLRLPEPVGRRLDLVPGALLGRRLAARAPRVVAIEDSGVDALHRLPDRLRHARPGHPRPRRAGLAELARGRARRRLAARRAAPASC